MLRDRPIYVHYGLSSRCNLRCRSCVIWQRDPPVQELTLDEVGELAGVLRGLGCAQVSLGGGEPALRQDLPDIAGAFIRRGIRTRVLTNGVAMTPALVGRLLAAGVRDISFSVDSLHPEVQESLDNARGTFGKRMRNLVSLAQTLPPRDTLPLLNIVVTPRNFRELPELIGLAEELGFFASVIPIHLAERREQAEHRFFSGAEDLRFSTEDAAALEEIYRQIIRHKRRGGRIINSSAFLRGSLQYLLTGKAPWPCRAGELFLSVAPNGMVSPCHAQEGTWGIHFRDLPARFGTPAYLREVREMVQTCEGCFRPCWAEVGFMVLDPGATLEMLRTQIQARRRRPRVDGPALLRRFGVDGNGGVP